MDTDHDQMRNRAATCMGMQDRCTCQVCPVAQGSLGSKAEGNNMARGLKEGQETTACCLSRKKGGVWEFSMSQ